jgi:tetratricopeptide (TPR) repeat protein
MDFDPRNNVIRHCVEGMGMEEKGQPEESRRLFRKAWDEATNDFERFIAAYYVARSQTDLSNKLQWFERSLQHALTINDVTVQSAFPAMYAEIAKCYEKLGDADNAKRNYNLAKSFAATPSDSGPFYHGTKADLRVGDLLTIGGDSNYKSGLVMNHIYFTAIANGARLAAALANGDGQERVYIVEPTGTFQNDPNVTDKKFPGNPTRSYRSSEPLKIIGELDDWARQTPEQVKTWREKIANSKGEIIN